MRERVHSGKDQFGAGLDDLTPPKAAPPESPKSPTEPVKRARGRPRKVKPEGDVVTVAEAMAELPAVKAMIAAQEQPLTDGSPAAEAFRKQREREQAVELSERSPKAIIAAREAQPVNGKASHVEAVSRQQRPFREQRIPDGFRDWSTDNASGIRVNASLDGYMVGIQFDNARPPTRDEKDILEAIHEPVPELRDGKKFTYDTGRKQWQRFDRDQPGANLLDAKRVAEDLIEARRGHDR